MPILAGLAPPALGLPRTAHPRKHRFEHLQLGGVGNWPRRESGAEFHGDGIVRIERRPLRQAWSIWVAALDEVRPIRRRRLRNRAVDGFPWPVRSIEAVEDVGQFRRVEGLVYLLFRTGRHMVPIVGVDAR